MTDITELKKWAQSFRDYYLWHIRTIKNVRGKYFIDTNTRRSISVMLLGLTEFLTKSLNQSGIKNSEVLLAQWKSLIGYTFRLGPGIDSPQQLSNIINWYNRSILPLTGIKL